MKIIITGGSGFIGTNMIDHLLSLGGYDVINLDFAKPRKEEHLGYWKNVDITDFEKLKSVVCDFSPDYIIHLAARTDILGKTVDDYRANTQGVKNLIEVTKLIPNLKKVLFTSSMLICRVGRKMADIFDYCPPNAYGESKVITEKLVREANLQYDWAILRPTSIWGEWFDTYKDFFIMVMKGRYVNFGKKCSTKTYGYVGNSVFQIEKLLIADTSKRSEEQRIFYIGDVPAYNIAEWANEIADICGRRIPTIPYWVIKCAALFGDFLGLFGLGFPKFPMCSFRLKNMTTDNIIDVSPITEIAPSLPYTRKEGSKKAMHWIKIHEGMSVPNFRE